MRDIKCKDCAYYIPQIGIQEELSGQLEAEIKPFGRCKRMEDPVREDEWCGQWTKWMSPFERWVKEHESP